jgi:hypothetical protein
MNLRIIQKWLTAAAENTSQLFSRKPWLINCIRQVFWLNPISCLPARAVACGGNSPANCGLFYTATGIAPEWNRTSLLMNFACTNFNRMQYKTIYCYFGTMNLLSTQCEKLAVDYLKFVFFDGSFLSTKYKPTNGVKMIDQIKPSWKLKLIFLLMMPTVIDPKMYKKHTAIKRTVTDVNESSSNITIFLDFFNLHLVRYKQARYWLTRKK